MVMVRKQALHACTNWVKYQFVSSISLSSFDESSNSFSIVNYWKIVEQFDIKFIEIMA